MRVVVLVIVGSIFSWIRYCLLLLTMVSGTFTNLSLLLECAGENFVVQSAILVVQKQLHVLSFLPDVDLENPILHVTRDPVDLYPSSLKDTYCERIRVVGHKRWKLNSYASSFRVLAKASREVPERYHDNIEICFHGNASVGLCQCEKECGYLQKGQWDFSTSPFGNKYIDIKFDKLGSITVSIEEEFHFMHLVCLGIGFVLLLLAPLVSEWVPFYYTSSVILGVLLVVIILLFQSMKLFPTGRKSFLYLTIYGIVLGGGSFLVHYFSMFVNSILQSFGLNEEMHNPVSVFILAAIFLAGAGLGYWMVRKFVLSKDGNVDAGIAQFVKWVMRVTASIFIFQSTLDHLLALVAVIICGSMCSLVTSSKWRHPTRKQGDTCKHNLWQYRARQAAEHYKRAEYLRRSDNRNSRSTQRSPSSPFPVSKSPTNGFVYSTPRKRALQQEDHFSIFHTTPVRKYSKKRWDDFTRESTRDALSEWACTPEVCDWIAENAQRVHLEPYESSDDSLYSSSDSSEEAVVESNPRFFHWL